MILYLFCFFSSALLAYLFSKNQNSKMNVLKAFFILLVPVFLATVRYGIGTDYFSYRYFFNDISFGKGYEPLFVVLNYVAKYIFKDYFGLLFLSSILTYGLILNGLLMLKNEVNVGFGMFAYFCYYYSSSFNVMQQMIAVSFVFCAVVYLYKKKTTLFFVFVLIATLFHFSAIISLLFFLFYKICKYSSWIYYLLLVVTILVFLFFGEYVLNLVLSIGYLGDFSIYTNPNSLTFIDFILDNVDLLMVVVVPMVINKMCVAENERYQFFRHIAAFGIAIIILGYNFRWFKRAFYYIDIIQIVLASINFKQIGRIGVGYKTSIEHESSLLAIDRKSVFVIRVLMITFFIFYFWYSVVYRGSNAIYPYQSIF